MATSQSIGPIDAVAQKLYTDFVKLRGDSNDNLLAAYFKWYNAVVGAISKTFDPVLATRADINKTCLSFPVAKLNETVRAQFGAICPDGALQYLEMLKQQRDQQYMMIMQGDISYGTQFDQTANMIFMSAQSQLGQLLMSYNMNKVCVAPSLKKILPPIKAFIDGMVANRTKTTNNVTVVFKSALASSAAAITEIKAITAKLKSCATGTNAVTNACVATLARKFNLIMHSS